MGMCSFSESLSLMRKNDEILTWNWKNACQLFSPGWPQTSVRKHRCLSEHQYTWLKDRGSTENKEAVPKSTELPHTSVADCTERTPQPPGSSHPPRRWRKSMVGGVMGWWGGRTSVMPGLETMRRKHDETEREDAELPIVGTKISGGTVAGSKAMEAKHQEHLLYYGVIS